MGTCESCGERGTTVVMQGASLAVLAKLLQQQRNEGRAAVQLIAAAAAATKGAPEPGKGTLVDVVA